MPRYEIARNVWAQPLVGVLIGHSRDSEREIQALKAYWYSVDALVWEMLPFQRDWWFDEISQHWDIYSSRIRKDYTTRFHAQLGAMKKLGGGLIVVIGDKGMGKSTLGQMVASRLGVPIYVIWNASESGTVIDGLENVELCLMIDESLQNTADLSTNEVIHDRNIWESNRKAGTWGIRIGVNVHPASYGDAVDMVLRPCGTNKRIYQATRFAMYKSSSFLGFACLQRKHLPTDPVFYGRQHGVWGEYAAKAKAYSLSVMQSSGAQSAVSSDRQTQHIAILEKELRKRYVEQGDDPPADLLCRRIYRELHLPALSGGYMSEVIAWAKKNLEEERSSGGSDKSTAKVSQSWQGLRKAIKELGRKYGVTENDATKAAAWYVPDWPDKSESEVAEDFGVGRDAIQKAKSRRFSDIPNAAWGSLGESWVAAHIDSAATTSGGKAGRPDVLYEEGDLGEVAVNVKLSLERAFRRRVETTPEDSWAPNAVCVLVMPRHLEVRVYPIRGAETTVNSAQGRLCAPEGVREAILRVIQSSASDKSK